MQLPSCALCVLSGFLGGWLENVESGGMMEKQTTEIKKKMSVSKKLHFLWLITETMME